MASSSGMLCGFHRNDILSDSLYRWKLRVAVCNPRTGFQHELPALNMAAVERDSNSPVMAHTWGQVKLEMRGDQEHFSIHVLCRRIRSGRFTVYTWHSSSQVWNESTNSGILTADLTGDLIFPGSRLQAYDTRSKAWTAIPIPGAKAWNDFPLPQGLQGRYSYCRVDPFRYGHKLMVLGQCDGAIVLLELEEEGGGRHWNPVAWATLDQFQFAEDETVQCPAYLVDWPLQGGDLLVMRAVTCSMLEKPVALHLKRHNWLELPTSVHHLNVQAVCIYSPSIKLLRSLLSLLWNNLDRNWS
ncbi:hypothetical protein SELMODRAFT_420714 [Selaginella moellendorffii]|uniref:Uncharacterized protein n=1 Tax=Selaginella moellendorffii TaxID=88036 RepID=D8SCV9_SELML|nr:hypothetical protein SELMODRAFT_420714 [Selaginella moellendorffii]